MKHRLHRAGWEGVTYSVMMPLGEAGVNHATRISVEDCTKSDGDASPTGAPSPVCTCVV